MTTPTSTRDLSKLARPSGAFAMLAVDQREALRAMFARHRTQPVTDDQVTQFKLHATRVLSPLASAVLLDKQFVLDQAIAEQAVHPSCALIAAADEFLSSPEELVADVRIDDAVDPGHYRDHGAVALKLLVVYRPDADARDRIRMVEDFLARCNDNGLISIIEPVSRAPLHGNRWDWNEGVLAAARELGALGADLYKAEVPYHGQGEPDRLRRDCAAITRSVTSPWVVLSSGVQQEAFPRAVELACMEGASGFLAGRAVWSACIEHTDYQRALRDDAVPRLRHLCATVDGAVSGR